MMNRKGFLRASLAAVGASVSTTLSGKASHDKHIGQVGFEHLPSTTNDKNMNTVLHRAETRGRANLGWLDSKHTFSFSHYYDPSRMHFGALRVLNDDIVQGGGGFGKHPHDNMEIVSIPLKGDLEHKDSMGNVAVIRESEIQIMSAGTGIYHSEYNKNANESVNFLQIWVFPKERDIKPRYDQRAFDPKSRVNKFQNIVSPVKEDEGVWINQDAWFHLGNLTKGFKTEYAVKRKENGVYAFVINGAVTINGQSLNKRDGFGVWNVDSISIQADEDAEVLLMDVPMNV